ncbi:histidine kinase [Flavobacterium akiainvivens]|uniref:Histidine kinase n=1 Tax=Flavobacterium akiainvivens TaxID=1202724 RepID=A0A0M9VH89_9FLAO|nr:histidine kinase [Flavobacterium akiainvivens]KOS05310.1 histidine kinase [Flavobacterium akiainvivens]SFQ76354.1 Histidine kinase [Flavobacterium akiainvivens]
MNTSSHQQFINENIFFRFLISPGYRVFRHLLFIGLIGAVLFNSGSVIDNPIIIFLYFIILFYINMYLLVPKFLFKNKNIEYCLSVIGILLTVVICGSFFNPFDKTNGINIPLVSFLTVLLFAASSSIKLFQKGMVDKQLIYELEQSKTYVELEQLKNQINPHFLFNMLNNANVLTQKDPEKASQVLMRLSDLLRYQLYDSARDNVFLTSDIHFLEDLLNLEKVRRDNFDFLISKEGDLSGVQVPPLLFISFVENAIKHNNDPTKSSYVNLYFHVRKGELFFKCINSKPVQKFISSTGGLGLTNIKRRLELLFPEKHRLAIEDSSEYYCVVLLIKI